MKKYNLLTIAALTLSLTLVTLTIYCQFHGNSNKVNIEQGQQSTKSGGDSSANPECKAFCSNI
jgi:hypothetical protein